MASTAYYAKWILLPDGSILTNGAVVVTGDTISSIGPRSAVRRYSDDRVVNLGKRLLLPGFINMHTHLEEGVFRGSVKNEQENFISWMLKKEQRLNNAGADEILSTVRLGIRESLANGITSIVDTTRTDISPLVFHDEPIRYWIMHEPFSGDTDKEQELVSSLRKRIRQSRRTGNIGIAPHALYS
jgi:cytosine/adenosine deaminase-related metal-dependent hydrolase